MADIPTTVSLEEAEVKLLEKQILLDNQETNFKRFTLVEKKAKLEVKRLEDQRQSAQELIAKLTAECKELEDYIASLKK